jgi:hypothetical protein
MKVIKTPNADVKRGRLEAGPSPVVNRLSPWRYVITLEAAA